MKKVKIWLVNEGVSQKQLAKEAGVSQAFISQLIHGKRRSAKAEAVLCWLGCSFFCPGK
jgi:predicted transcriptional regulator